MGKKKHHTPEQIIHLLRQAEVELAGGQPLAQVCRKLGVTEVYDALCTSRQTLPVGFRPCIGVPPRPAFSSHRCRGSIRWRNSSRLPRITHRPCGPPI